MRARAAWTLGVVALLGGLAWWSTRGGPGASSTDAGPRESAPLPSGSTGAHPRTVATAIDDRGGRRWVGQHSTTGSGGHEPAPALDAPLDDPAASVDRPGPAMQGVIDALGELQVRPDVSVAYRGCLDAIAVRLSAAGQYEVLRPGERASGLLVGSSQLIRECRGESRYFVYEPSDFPAFEQLGELLQRSPGGEPAAPTGRAPLEPGSATWFAVVAFPEETLSFPDV